MYQTTILFLYRFLEHFKNSPTTLRVGCSLYREKLYLSLSRKEKLHAFSNVPHGFHTFTVTQYYTLLHDLKTFYAVA